MDSIEVLEGCLIDPLSPAWSSKGVKDMFENLDGRMIDKQMRILPIVDQVFHEVESQMTSVQYHFLRELTLHAVYPDTSVDFLKEDIQWLLDRFDQNQLNREPPSLRC